MQRYKEVGVAGDVRANNVSIIDRAQTRRIVGLNGSDQAAAELGECSLFALGGFCGADADRAAAALGQPRQRAQGIGCRAVARDQAIEGARTDVLGADQSQPLGAFAGAQWRDRLGLHRLVWVHGGQRCIGQTAFLVLADPF